MNRGELSVESFAAEYAGMSEDELLALARSYDSLVDPAKSALRAEFARRHLEPPILEAEQEPADRRLVTVRRFRDLSEAVVARGVVESAGIFCLLRDENTIRLDWQMSNMIGGIRLQVAEQDADAAVAILSEPSPETIPIEGQPDYEQPRCPRCNSTDIHFEGSDRRSALASLYLFSLPAPLGQKSWLCDHCGCRWVVEDDDPEGSENI